MSSIAFIGDCYINRKISIDGDLPKTIILNWEHAYPEEEHQLPQKVSLGLSGRFYPASFPGKKIIAGLANNHTADYGEHGLRKTIEEISSYGWESYGASINETASKIHIFESDGKKLAVLFYAHTSSSPITSINGKEVVNEYQRSKLYKDIATAKNHCAEHITVVIHWGAEEVNLPPPEVVKEARIIIDMGVDLIIGHHAHVIQPVELYKGKYIFYGIGNFYFPNFSTTIIGNNGEKKAFAKNQSAKNKKSRIVILKTPCMTVSERCGKADINSQDVFISASRIKTTKLTKLPYYGLIFKAGFISGKIKAKIQTLISERRLPKASFLVNLFKLFREKNYK